MKIKLLNFADGKQEFATENIQIQINKQSPVSIEDLEVDEAIMEEFLKHPLKVKFDKKEKKFISTGKDK